MLKAGAMGLMRGQIERKLSSMLGVDVSFEKFNVSLLGGSIDAQGVTVSGADPSTPLLTVRRVRAEISLTAALKKEFVVKSLTIEKPVLTIVRGPDGKLNLPTRPTTSDTSATARQTSDSAASEGDSGSWKLDAQRVLVVDAEVHYRESTGYHASIEQLLAELKQAGAGFEFTLLADSVARRDVSVSVGPLKLSGTASNMPSLLKWRQARVGGSFELGEMLRGKLDIPSLTPPEVKTEFQGSFNLDLLRKLLPPGKTASM